MFRTITRALTAPGVLACIALGVPSVSADLGPLESIVRPGVDGAWQISVGDDVLGLRNERTSDDLTYYYINSTSSDFGKRTVNVNVQVPRATGGSLAGILYGFDIQDKTYYLFAVAGDRTVNLIYRDKTGFHNRFKTGIEIGPDSIINLRLVESGKQITLFVNSRRVGQFENARLGQGSVGVIAGDIGDYRFSEFSVAPFSALKAPAVARTSSGPG